MKVTKVNKVGVYIRVFCRICCEVEVKIQVFREDSILSIQTQKREEVRKGTEEIRGFGNYRSNFCVENVYHNRVRLGIYGRTAEIIQENFREKVVVQKDNIVQRQEENEILIGIKAKKNERETFRNGNLIDKNTSRKGVYEAINMKDRRKGDKENLLYINGMVFVRDVLLHEVYIEVLIFFEVGRKI